MEVHNFFFVVLVTVLGSALAQNLPAIKANVLASNLGPVDLQQALDLAMASIKQSGDQATAAAEAARTRVEEVIQSLHKAQEAAATSLQQVAGLTSTLGDTAASLASNTSSLLTSCVAASNAKTLNLTIQTGYELLSCFTDKIREAERILSDVILLGANAVAVVPNAVAGIQRCPAPSLAEYLNRLACIGGEATKASAESLRIVFEITQNVGKANLLVATLQTDIQMCVGLKIVTFVFKAGLVTADFGMCVIRGL